MHLRQATFEHANPHPHSHEWLSLSSSLHYQSILNKLHSLPIFGNGLSTGGQVPCVADACVIRLHLSDKLLSLFGDAHA